MDSPFSPDSPRRKHLTLHIPNSYPRSFHSSSPSSPSSATSTSRGKNPSPRPQPQQQGQGQGQEQGSPSPVDREEVTHQTSDLRSCSAQIKRAFKSRRCQGETARDFLARERTFFSWLRLSQILSILSGAILLRFKPGSIQRPSKDESGTIKLLRKGKSPLKRYMVRKMNQDIKRRLSHEIQVGKSMQVKSNPPNRDPMHHQFHFSSTREIISEIQHDKDSQTFKDNQQEALRFLDSLESISSHPSNSRSSFINPNPIPISTSTSTSTSKSISTFSDPFLTSKDLVLIIGISFFILAISSLLISWFDYLKILKYLELTDRDEVEGVQQSRGNETDTNDITSADSGNRSERERKCDAIVAGMAKSSKLIKILEAILCIAIGSLAILLLVFQKL